MELWTLVVAAILGLVEGLTEFIPVSSTGHLILLVDLLGFQGPPGKVFEVVIQLGAILAVCVVYFTRLWRVLMGLASDPGARRFAAAVIIAHLAGATQGWVDALSVVYLALRIGYTVAYVGDRPTLRSLLWVAALGCVIALFVAAATAR